MFSALRVVLVDKLNVKAKLISNLSTRVFTNNLNCLCRSHKPVQFDKNVRNFSIKQNVLLNQSMKNIPNQPFQSSKNAFWYILSGFVIMIGASYAAVPLFKIFCESQGIDVNTDFRDLDVEKIKNKLLNLKRVENRSIKVKFVASTSADLLWKFEPCQEEIVVAPGETALAFFRAKNLTNRPVIGIGINMNCLF